MDRSEAGKLGWEKTSELRLKRAKEKSLKVRQAYESDPKYCLKCGTILPFEKRRTSFCNQSCAASYRNRGVTRHFKHSNLCKCGNVKKRHNKWCAECIVKRVYNPRIAFEAISNDKQRRKRLLEMRGNQCQDCGLTEWIGKPISLELHHIDGDTDNNCQENLLLLCPNCHAIQPTHRRRNKLGKRQLMRRQRYAEGKTW
jgi:hypothetical protein